MTDKNCWAADLIQNYITLSCLPGKSDYNTIATVAASKRSQKIATRGRFGRSKTGGHPLRLNFLDGGHELFNRHAFVRHASTCLSYDFHMQHSHAFPSATAIKETSISGLCFFQFWDVDIEFGSVTLVS
jgi:hypothetical protein